jgi:hypothetical protein
LQDGPTTLALRYALFGVTIGNQKSNFDVVVSRFKNASALPTALSLADASMSSASLRSLLSRTALMSGAEPRSETSGSATSAARAGALRAPDAS